MAHMYQIENFHKAISSRDMDWERITWNWLNDRGEKKKANADKIRNAH